MLGIKVLEERKSPINGKIRVIRNLAFGTHIQVENLTQSGGVVEDIWRSALRRIKNLTAKRVTQFKINNCLILGLGGGTAAKIVRKFWPNAEITGIDIDPIIVSLGKRYLGSKIDKEIISDAGNFVRNTKEKYDLILVDLYKGYEYPKKFESELFLRLVLRLLTPRRIVVFNRLYFREKRPEAMRFGKKLEKIFPKVEYFYPEANVMFLCYN